MTLLNQKTQEEVTEIIKYLLEPISGEVESFGNPYEIRITTKVGNEPERRRTEQLHSIFLKTNLGEKSLTLSSAYFGSTKDAVWRACHDFVSTDVPFAGTQHEILKKLYSQEILDFAKDK